MKQKQIRIAKHLLLVCVLALFAASYIATYYHEHVTAILAFVLTCLFANIHAGAVSAESRETAETAFDKAVSRSFGDILSGKLLDARDRLLRRRQPDDRNEWETPSVLGFSYADVRGMSDEQIVDAGLASGDRLAAELANRCSVVCEKLGELEEKERVSRCEHGVLYSRQCQFCSEIERRKSIADADALLKAHIQTPPATPEVQS